MKKVNSLYLIGAFSVLLIAMLVGLVVNVVPAFPAHGGSMVIGTLSYVAMAGIVLASKFENKQFSIASGIAGVVFAASHIFTEMNLFARAGLTSVTNPFGYAAVGAFILAGIIFGLNKVKNHSYALTGVNGLMTAGVTFVFYHVASIAAVRESMLFFVPFTLLFVWTIGQFAMQAVELVKTHKQTA